MYSLFFLRKITHNEKDTASGRGKRPIANDHASPEKHYKSEKSLSLRTPLEKFPSRRLDTTTPLGVVSHISIGFQPRVLYSKLASEVDVPA